MDKYILKLIWLMANLLRDGAKEDAANVAKVIDKALAKPVSQEDKNE